MDIGKYFNLSIEFLKAPSKAFESIKKKSMGEAFRYMLVMGVIVSVLGGIVGYAVNSVLMSLLPAAAEAMTPLMVATTIVFGYVFVIILNVLFSLWLHLWVYVFGSRKGLEQTMKAVFYSDTPSYLLGWIPIVGFITLIWSLVLNIIGLMKLQGMNGIRAVGAVVIAVAIPTVMMGLVFFVYVIPLMMGQAGFV
jgi:hypothetical protein